MTRHWLASGTSATQTRNTGRRIVGSTISTERVGEVDYFTKERGGIVDWQRDGKFLKEDGYYTDLIGNEAVSIIDHHDTSKPLFLYVASLAPHAPYQAPQELIDDYKDLAGDTHRHTYAAMITTSTRKSDGSSMRSSRRACSTTRSSSSRATMAAPPAPCSRRERAPRRA